MTRQLNNHATANFGPIVFDLLVGLHFDQVFDFGISEIGTMSALQVDDHFDFLSHSSVVLFVKGFGKLPYQLNIFRHTLAPKPKTPFL